MRSPKRKAIKSPFVTTKDKETAKEKEKPHHHKGFFGKIKGLFGD